MAHWRTIGESLFQLLPSRFPRVPGRKRRADRTAQLHRFGATSALEARLLLAANFAEFVDPHPAPGNQFGSQVVPLSTGNVVITSPYDDAGGTNAGAVYLFNGDTGALISTLKGSQADVIIRL